MKATRAPLFLLALLPCISGTAQSLTAFNCPTPGDAYHIALCEEVPPGSAGTGMTWSFASLTCEPFELFEVVAPSNTNGWNADFPTATAAFGTLDTYWTYFRQTADAYQTLGSRGTNNTGQDFTFPMDNFRFPMSYGGSFTDAFGGSGTDTNGDYTFNGTIDGELDGTGSIIVPYGTLNNILRAHYVIERTQLQGATTSVTTQTQWVYTRTGTKQPIVAINHFTISINGGPSIAFGQAELLSEDDVVGMLEPAGRHGFSVSPVPSAGSVCLTLDRAASEELTVSVVDDSGRVLLTEMLFAGVDRHELDLQALPAGSYIVRVISQGGAMSTARLLKE